MRRVWSRREGVCTACSRHRRSRRPRGGEASRDAHPRLRPRCAVRLASAEERELFEQSSPSGVGHKVATRRVGLPSPSELRVPSCARTRISSRPFRIGKKTAQRVVLERRAHRPARRARARTWEPETATSSPATGWSSSGIGSRGGRSASRDRPDMPRRRESASAPRCLTQRALLVVERSCGPQRLRTARPRGRSAPGLTYVDSWATSGRTLLQMETTTTASST